MSFAAPFTIGFYTDGLTGTAAGTSTQVPHPYPVAIAGHPYLLDDKQTGVHKHETIPTLRPYFITADTLGEKNINPESLWRASQNTWHKGAGQRHLDRTDSDPARFWASKGVNVWTRWQLTLLPDTTQARASVNTNLRMAVAGTYLYVTDGNTLAYTTNLTAFTTVTGTPVAAAGAVASDGNTVYVAYAGNGVYSTTRGAASAAAFVTGTDTYTTLAYVKGRLMGSIGRSIYNITATGPTPTPLYSQPNTDFAWVGFAEGNAYIYAAGYSGDKSLIYKIGIQPDGTALSAPVQAGQLPDGEIIRSIGAYLGFVLLGTSLGFRVGIPTSSGDLQIGPLIATSSCFAFEGQGKYVWFGWDNYDSGSTGLGRLDLSVFNDVQTPAYASDLMVTAQGQIVDIATFLNKRVFTVAGSGVYTESTSLVTSGTLDSGLITYDLPDDKIALYLNVKHLEPLVGSHTAYIASDNGIFINVGSHDAATTFIEEPFAIGEMRAETFEIRQQLSRGSDPTTGPTVTRHTLEANPAVDSGTFITVPVLLVEIETETGCTRDPAAELAFLKALRQASNRATYQEASQSYAMTVEDVTFLPTHLTTDKTAFNGTAVVKMKTV